VFKRDKEKCVVPYCKCKPDDAHHLIERKLWDENTENGGYILENLVSVCERHHKLCENNTILPRTLRAYAGINEVLLPKSFDKTKEYDKWGRVLEPPARERMKYPHTPYLPFSPSADEKDVRESGYMDIRCLLNKPLHISIKMDGSNILLTRNNIAARNGYDATGKSFDMAKQTHSMFKHLIPEDEMWFGEWLYAKHSIHYIENLKLTNYLQLFGIYNKKTHMWAGITDIHDRVSEVIIETDITPPLAVGVNIPEKAPSISDILNGKSVYTNEKDLKNELIKIGNSAVKGGHEGIIVRNMYPFHHSRWNENIAKFVRANHIQTNKHWSRGPITRNEIMENV